MNSALSNHEVDFWLSREQPSWRNSLIVSECAPNLPAHEDVWRFAKSRTEALVREKFRGANLSSFCKIRRFHLEIGNSHESCRSVKKKMFFVFGGGGVSSDLRVICVTSPAAFFSPVGNGRNGPALLCLWLAYLGVEARTGAGCLVLSLWPRKELKILCQFWSYR